MPPYRPIRTLLIGLAALTAPAAAAAQSGFNEIESDARERMVEGRGPFAGISEIGALSRGWSVNTFYALYRGDPRDQTVFWAIRRETGGREGSAAVVWADSRSCPAVAQVLIDMEGLPAVRPDAIRLGEEADELSLIMDGTAHRFWNRWARSGRQEAVVGLEITGNVDSPIAVWWVRSADRLAACWTDEPPT